MNSFAKGLLVIIMVAAVGYGGWAGYQRLQRQYEQDRQAAYQQTLKQIVKDSAADILKNDASVYGREAIEIQSIKDRLEQNPHDTKAMIDYGNHYSLGRGVLQSDDKAAEWYRKARDGGDAEGGRLLESLERHMTNYDLQAH